MKPNPYELKWHVVYTRPRTERKVAEGISELGVESFLPMHTVVRQWSDRKKKMEVPLFPNYVFAKVSDVDRGHLFSVRELVRFVSFNKRPVVVTEKEIASIRMVLEEDVDVSQEDYFENGCKVRIAYGQFSGLEGTMVRRHGKDRLVMRIEALAKAFSFDVPYTMVELIHDSHKILKINS